MTPAEPRIEGLQHLRRVAATALDDDAYRQQLLDDPAGVLKQAGITVPDGVQVVVHQNTTNEIHLVLPAQQQEEQQLTAEETDLRTLTTAIHF
jgi:hypothetical protein